MTDGPGLVLVIGVGRSGTSLITGILGRAGMRVPQPELQADETNPRGFGEPSWVVDLHERLLDANAMTVLDARPQLWDRTWAVADDPAVAADVRRWLAAELADGDVVVVKDPRSSWFLPLWTQAAAANGAGTALVTMLRHPAAVLVSARSSYGRWQSDANRAAAWINVMLETERRTRDATRAFVSYDGLLVDWEPELVRIGERLGLAPLAAGDLRARFPPADELVDPSLRRSTASWESLAVPPSLRELAEEVWAGFGALTRPGPEDPTAHAMFDAARERYRDVYAEAEAIAQSSVSAVRIRLRIERERHTKPPPPPPSTLRRLARRARRVRPSRAR